MITATGRITQKERIDERIRTYGSMTSIEGDKLAISNISARMTDARRVYPIKRVKVRKKHKDQYGERPIYYRYYYDKERIRFPRSEEILEWLDEPKESE